MKALETSILCRAAVALPSTVTGEMMYMPGGAQSITPWEGMPEDQPRIQVVVDVGSARALDAQRAALVAKGKRPYFDFNHEDGEASFWPTEFFWKDVDAASSRGQEGKRQDAASTAGVYARGEWSDLGEQAITGKRYRQFSPVFHVDSKRANPARIVCRDWAKPNRPPHSPVPFPVLAVSGAAGAKANS